MRAAVVGAGPAGLSAGLGLLRRGVEVTVFEASTEPRRRVCGAFLNPEAMRHLEWLGLEDDAQALGVPVSQVHLTSPKKEHAPFPIGQNGKSGLALTRVELEKILVDSFIARGGRFEPQARVTGCEKEKHGWLVRGRDFLFESDFVVLADGRFSIGHAKKKQSAGWYGWNALFEGAVQKPGSLSLHFFPGGYVGTLAFKDGHTNVCGLIYKKEGETLDWEKVSARVFKNQPCLNKYLSGAKRRSEWRGVGPLPYKMGIHPGSGALLAGDAAAVGDPFMGEGIGRALGSGALIFNALQSLQERNMSVTELHTAYEALWNKHYIRRHQIGFISRGIIRNRFLFQPILDCILGSRALLGWITRASHIGYQPQVSANFW